MSNKNNFKFSAILWFTHFLTDAIAAFALATIAIKNISDNNFIIDKIVWFEILWYFIFYNFLAFFLQIFLWYFLDKIKTNLELFNTSKKILLSSIVLYIIWSIFLNISYVVSILLIWIWSCLFHISSWNITMLANKNKAINLWIFASWWVIWLSFWLFSATYLPYALIIINLILLAIIRLIYSYDKYKISNHIYKKYYKFKSSHIFYIVSFLWILLIIRSAVWTNFQIDFSNNQTMLFYLAITAFLWKITWWILEDIKYFNNKYFIIIWLTSLMSIVTYFSHFKNLFFLLLSVFTIQIFISPLTVMLYRIIPQHRSKIIWFTFWLSLILWFLLLKII